MIKSLSCLFSAKILFFGLILAFSHVKADESLLSVFTVNYPLKYFAERIADDQASVIYPIPTDIDPAFWSPKAIDVAQIQKADIIFINGAHYAKWLPKVSLPLSKLSNTSAKFSTDYIHLEADIKHNHGSGGEHSHAGTAFTTWLDLKQADQQALAILTLFNKKKPAQTKLFTENYITLQNSLIDLDKKLIKIGAELNGQALLGSHPVYQYLKRRYQLNLKSVHWEPGEAPTEAQWQQLKYMLQTHQARWMLWEAEPIPETVAKLDALGIKSIIFSPCANTPETGDFLTVMAKNIDQLESIISIN